MSKFLEKPITDHSIKERKKKLAFYGNQPSSHVSKIPF
jgi:hypothetical protein